MSNVRIPKNALVGLVGRVLEEEIARDGDVRDSIRDAVEEILEEEVLLRLASTVSRIVLERVRREIPGMLNEMGATPAPQRGQQVLPSPEGAFPGARDAHDPWASSEGVGSVVLAGEGLGDASYIEEHREELIANARQQFRAAWGAESDPRVVLQTESALDDGDGQMDLLGEGGDMGPVEQMMLFGSGGSSPEPVTPPPSAAPRVESARATPAPAQRPVPAAHTAPRSAPVQTRSPVVQGAPMASDAELSQLTDQQAWMAQTIAQSLSDGRATQIFQKSGGRSKLGGFHPGMPRPAGPNISMTKEQLEDPDLAKRMREAAAQRGQLKSAV